ncbi:hypothetical protein [Novosphingobium sp.]|uniref:hypothetical protein n=1 Tax=Novosphingobium sp. TaxID=1874826 RepID=UPI00262C06F4|nr:hypothetical protein [Novosphingobium sp.]
MALFKLAFASAVAYGLYRYSERSRVGQTDHAAFAAGETNGANLAKARHAGSEAMRSDPPEWDRADQASDESFPASDPPGTY